MVPSKRQMTFSLVSLCVSACLPVALRVPLSLSPVVGEERCVPAALVLGEHVHLRLKLLVDRYAVGLVDDLNRQQTTTHQGRESIAVCLNRKLSPLTAKTSTHPFDCDYISNR